MRLGLISDVHADIVALERAWAHLMAAGAERVLCAGDVVGYGPEPDRVAAFLAEHRVLTVRGNHDLWALRREPDRGDRYGGAAPGPAARAFLEGLPPCLMLSLAGRFVAVSHQPPAVEGPDSSALRPYLEFLGADLLVVGHTHAPCWSRGPSGVAINPGSLIGGLIRSSQTFAVVDLATLEPTFHDARTGEPIVVTPIDEDAGQAVDANDPRPTTDNG